MGAKYTNKQRRRVREVILNHVHNISCGLTIKGGCALEKHPFFIERYQVVAKAKKAK